jgi:methylmalonyl-CoA mutase N-terminal domain/subunit
MPAIMQAVTEYATVGEITAVLKEIFGTYQEPIRF